jgi:hypothetical protein
LPCSSVMMIARSSRLDEVVPGAKNFGSLLRQQGAPGGEGGRSGLDCLPRLRRPHVGHMPDHLAGGGIGNHYRGPGLGRAPAPADESKLTEQPRIGQTRHPAAPPRFDRSHASVVE